MEGMFRTGDETRLGNREEQAPGIGRTLNPTTSCNSSSSCSRVVVVVVVVVVVLISSTAVPFSSFCYLMLHNTFSMLIIWSHVHSIHQSQSRLQHQMYGILQFPMILLTTRDNDEWDT